jgi:hypothetical protein
MESGNGTPTQIVTQTGARISSVSQLFNTTRRVIHWQSRLPQASIRESTVPEFQFGTPRTTLFPDLKEVVYLLLELPPESVDIPEVSGIRWSARSRRLA